MCVRVNKHNQIIQQNDRSAEKHFFRGNELKKNGLGRKKNLPLSYKKIPWDQGDWGS